MEKRKVGILLSIIAASSLIVGCGGTSGTTSTTTLGTVVDDYIKGAKVCADANGNGIADDAVCVVTDDIGRFKFAQSITDPIVVTGGTDIGTGQPFTGTFLAPAGSSVANPLTTLIRSMEQAGTPLAEAQTIVKTQLGLPDVDLTSFDPLKELQFGTDTATKENAQKVLAQQSKIQVVLNIVATTIAASSATVDAKSASGEAAKQIVTLMKNNTGTATVDIASEASVKEVIDKVATEKNTTIPTEVRDAIATQVKTASDLVVNNITAVSVTDETSALDAITQANTVLSVVSGSMTTVVTNAVSGSDRTGLDSMDIATDVATVTVTRPTITIDTINKTPITVTTGAEGGN